MAYIGRNPAIGTQKVLDSLESQFNGTLTTFDLRYNSNTIYPPIASALIVSLGGVLQEPGVAYTVASDTITFATAPPTGSDCWILLYTEFGAAGGGSANFTVSNNLTIGNELHGPANFIIDPATIGDNTGTVEIKGNLTVQGTQTTVNSTTVDLDHLSLGDNEIANFGSGNDLQIYHNGSHSYISESSGTGDLRLVSSRTLIRDENDANHCIIANSGGSVDLYHNGSVKFATTSDGIQITGRNYSTGDYAYFATNSSSNASLTLKKSAAAADSIDYLQLRDSNNALKLKLGGDGVIYTSDVLASHEGDTNTRLRFPGNDTFTIETAGNERLRIDSSGYLKLSGRNVQGTTDGDKLLRIYQPSRTDAEQDVLLLQSHNTNTANSIIIGGGDSSFNAATDISFRTATINTTGGTERLRIASDGAITVTSDGSDNDGANITLKHNNNNTTDVVSALIFSNNVGEVARISGRTDGGNNNGGITFHTDNAGTTGERLRITPDGKIGIGTDNPSNFLHVKNYTTANNYITAENTTAGNAGIRLKNNAGDYLILANADLRFYDNANSVDRLCITSTGNVQVKTDGAQLYGAGTLLVNSGSSAGRIDVYGGSTNRGGEINLYGGSNSDGIISFRTGAGANQQPERLRIDSAGDLLQTWRQDAFIGQKYQYNSTTYYGGLEIDMGSSRTLGIVARSDDTRADIFFKTGLNATATEKMRIMHNGNVGIGTNNPNKKLHVEGDARVTGTLTVGTSTTIINGAHEYPTIRPTLDLNFAATKTLDRRITFTRDSIGTYTDELGVVQYAPNNVPRFDHDPATGESLGLLIEEARTNLFLNSDSPVSQRVTLSNSTAYSFSFYETGTLTIETASTTVTGSELTTNGEFTTNLSGWVVDSQANASVSGGVVNIELLTTYRGINQTISTTPGKFYQVVTRSRVVSGGGYADFYYNTSDILQTVSNSATSFVVKTGYFLATSSSTKIRLLGRNSGQIIEFDYVRVKEVSSSTVSTVTKSSADLTRSSNTFTTGTSIVDDNEYWINISGSVDKVQLEQGSFPTSYIPTSGSTATRAADNAKITGTNFTDFHNAAEGTLYGEYKSTSETAPYLVMLSDGTDNNRTIINANFDSYQGVVKYSNGTNQAVIDGGTPIANANNKTALAFKKDDFALSLNGGTAVTDTSGNVSVNNMMTIGSRHGNDSFINSTIKAIKYYPKRLPNAQLQGLTAS